MVVTLRVHGKCKATTIEVGTVNGMQCRQIATYSLYIVQTQYDGGNQCVNASLCECMFGENAN